MIKNLKRKFIVAAMTSVATVVAVIIGVIVLSSYMKTVQTADFMLDFIMENRGNLPLEKIPPPFEFRGERMSPEALYETRYFSAVLNIYNEILNINMFFISAVDENIASQMIETVVNSNEKQGFYGTYRFRVNKTESETTVVFLDCYRSLDTFKTLLFTCLIVSFSGLFAVFILVMIFSEVAVSPIATNYAKQKQFITDASHEIKTPLAIIAANAEVIELNTGESEWTKSIKNQTERLGKLTENLITLAKIEEEGGNPHTMAKFSLSDTVSDEIEPFCTLASSNGKTLTANIEKNIFIIGNEPMIRQLISILTDNAIKYSKENGEIFISVKRQHKTAVIVFKNFTDTIKPGNHDELFDRFSRSDTSRSSKTGGHGIGLSVANAITRLHKGKISAFSPSGDSLVITVVI